MNTAFSVVVSALETLKNDKDEKAGLYLTAILKFDFIVVLVVAEHILSSTVALTNYLQKRIQCIPHLVIISFIRKSANHYLRLSHGFYQIYFWFLEIISQRYS
jgi:hypothetical protein